MAWEIINFVNNDVSKYNELSIEVSRLVRSIKDMMDKEHSK
jgi:hypothetical protein